MLCALCALGVKKDGKVRKLDRYITQRSIPVRILTSRQTEYEQAFRSRQGVHFDRHAEIYSSSTTGSDIHHRILATMVLLTFLLKCCVMIQQEVQDVSYVCGN